MNVFILAPSSTSLRTFRGTLIEEMLALGCCVSACAPNLVDDDVSRRWLEARGVLCFNAPINRSSLNPVSDLIAIVRLVGMLRNGCTDLFFGYTAKPVILGLVASRLAGIKRRAVMIAGLGYAFTGEAKGKRRLLRGIMKWLYKGALRYADVVVFQNPDDCSEFQKLKLVSPLSRVEIVNGSGVDLAQFPPARMQHGPLQFLMIARLLGDKGVREYAKACSALATRWPDVGFHLVGSMDTNLDSIPQEEVDQMIRGGQIKWHGKLNDVREILSRTHVFVLPSYREGTPRSVLEAMATGRPIITTDVPGCRETVIDGVNGILVPARDETALTHAMERLLSEPDLVSRMGAESLRLAKDKYDARVVSKQMLTAFGLIED